MSARGSGTRQKRAGSGESSPSVDAPQAGATDARDPELLGTILDLTSARFAYYDLENRCRFFSPAFGRAVGASPDQILGRTPEEMGMSAAPRERVERLLARRPSLRVVLMSGYAAGIGGVAIDGSHRFIEKPFGRNELTAIVAQVLAEPQTS
jgi:PAS domain-containing protein